MLIKDWYDFEFYVKYINTLIKLTFYETSCMLEYKLSKFNGYQLHFCF